MKNTNPRSVDFDNSIELVSFEWYNLSMDYQLKGECQMNFVWNDYIMSLVKATFGARSF